jgi:hypothetical protein
VLKRRLAGWLLAITTVFGGNSALAAENRGNFMSWPSYHFGDQSQDVLAMANDALNAIKTNREKLNLPEEVNKLTVELARNLEPRCLTPGSFGYYSGTKIFLCAKGFSSLRDHTYYTFPMAFIDPAYADASEVSANYSPGLMALQFTAQGGSRIRSGACPVAYMAMLIKNGWDPEECFAGTIPHIDEYDNSIKADKIFVDLVPNWLTPITQMANSLPGFSTERTGSILTTLDGKSNAEKVKLLYDIQINEIMLGSISQVVFHEISHFLDNDRPDHSCSGLNAELKADRFAAQLIKRINEDSTIDFDAGYPGSILFFEASILDYLLGDLSMDTFDSFKGKNAQDLPAVLRGPAVNRVISALTTLAENPEMTRVATRSLAAEDVADELNSLRDALNTIRRCN